MTNKPKGARQSWHVEWTDTSMRRHRRRFRTKAEAQSFALQLEQLSQPATVPECDDEMGVFPMSVPSAKMIEAWINATDVMLDDVWRSRR